MDTWRHAILAIPKDNAIQGIRPNRPYTQMRDELRRKFWPNEDAWTGERELGFFQAPRTLPLLLLLLSSKTLSGRKNPSRVYIELWARHMGGGVIDMRPETEHAYAAGYTSN